MAVTLPVLVTARSASLQISVKCVLWSFIVLPSPVVADTKAVLGT